MTKFSPHVDFEYKLSTMCFKIKKKQMQHIDCWCEETHKFFNKFSPKIRSKFKVHSHHAKVLAHQIATKIFGDIIKINFEGGCQVVFKSSLQDANFAKWDIVWSTYTKHNILPFLFIQLSWSFWIFFIWLSFNDSTFMFVCHSIFPLGLNWINQTNIEIWLAEWTLNLHIWLTLKINLYLGDD